MSQQDKDIKQKWKIEKPYLIVCEGRDAEEFLTTYLNKMPEPNPSFKDIQVISFGGNSELTKRLGALQNAPNFYIVKSLLIIRDAEKDFKAAIQSIQKSLKSNGFSVPESPFIWKDDKSKDENKDKTLKIGFLLFPTCNANPTNGTLEDLCMSILPSDKAPELG